jgi:hypothetical protein
MQPGSDPWPDDPPFDQRVGQQAAGIVWMIIGMIKAHPTEDRMARRAWVDALFIGGILGRA